MAKRYIGRISTGVSKPFIVECFDNKSYVIKYLGNDQSDKILINELICYRLARKVGIPVPEPRIVHIPNELIEFEIGLQTLGVSSGRHFGSLYYKDTVTFTGVNSLKSISNKEAIAKIIAFDYWVGNDDRCDNLGNLLINTSKNKNCLIAIDYGNAFNGPDWIQCDLKYTDIHIVPVDGRVYSCLFSEIINEDCFDEICTSIESLDIKDIEECTENIPREWGLDGYYKDLICQFLFHRKSKIRGTINYVVKKMLKL